MKRTFAILSFCLCCLLTFAQSKVEITLQLLTSEVVGEVTLDQEPTFEWIKKIKDDVEAHLKNEEGDKEVMVLVSMHRTKDATIEIAAKPKLEDASLKSLAEKLSKHTAPRTKFAGFSFAIICTVNKGCKKEMDYSPALASPTDRELAEYKKLDLAGKKAALQGWVQYEVIPMVAHYETNVDAQFAGVLNIGKMVEKGTYLIATVESLTENNPDYWRATMEMSKGNQLIPFTKICMHVIKGEFDKAKRLLFVTGIFADESSLPVVLHEEISSKLDLLLEELGAEIDKGIALHDKGKYQEAIAIYEKLLETFPYSAWLNYEIYFSKAAEIDDLEKSDAEWKRSKPVIYACDPMYHMNVRANTGKEGYLMFRRQEITMLFKTKGQMKKDIVNYADIALDLENYGFAAQLYWLILSYIPKEDHDNRNILTYYLYCLDKLGDKETVKNFEGDFPKEFEKVEKERRKIMEESSIYSSFEKKE